MLDWHMKLCGWHNGCTRGIEVGSVSSSQLVALWWENQAGFKGQTLKPTLTLAFPLECTRFTSPPQAHPLHSGRAAWENNRPVHK